MIDGCDRRPGPLEALASYYARMKDAEAPGWSREKFGWCIVIDADGEPVDVLNLHDLSGKKPTVKLYEVPAGVKRTVGIAPNFLWDKSSYSLGRTAGEGKRTAQEHAAFVAANLARLAGTNDEGLLAFRRFLERWTPERFDAAPFVPDMLDANILFQLAGDGDYLHRRPAARRLVEAVADTDDRETIFCLATGERGPAARLHPTIKGVENAQSSGAALVSFNLDAFTSYGKEQGDNAPTTEAAAFRYGAALNRLLARGNNHNRVRRPIGDATTIFWADAADAKAAEAADEWAYEALEVEDAEEARKIGEELDAVAKGKPLSSLRPAIQPGTRFHVLGLSPNAARLSVRYWLSDDIDIFAERLARYHADMKIEPVPWGKPPSINYLLAQTTALQGKFENIPPQLAGEVMRAILTGTPYPRVWLAAALIRLRAGDDPGRGWHAAAIRAVLARIKRKGEPPVSLDRDHQNTGYQLGRLFAVYELAQRAALGQGVKATIRDKYFGAASSAPASVFPLIITNGQNHLSKVRKEKPGWAYLIEKELEEVVGHITPAMPFSLPRSLRLEDQGEFAIGYYHQRKARLGNGATDAPGFDEDTQEGDTNDD